MNITTLFRRFHELNEHMVMILNIFDGIMNFYSEILLFKII